MQGGGINYYRYWYYNRVATLANLNFEFYVDLFLLWLLYRFMKPEIVLQDGRTEASVLLFAHDGKRATEVLRYTYTEVEETR